MADKARIETILDSITRDEFFECRALRHSWRYTTVDKKDRGRTLVQGTICTRCGTQRWQEIDARTGELREGRTRMKYEKGYLLTGLGRPTRADNGAIRLRSLEAWK